MYLHIVSLNPTTFLLTTIHHQFIKLNHLESHPLFLHFTQPQCHTRVMETTKSLSVHLSSKVSSSNRVNPLIWVVLCPRLICLELILWQKGLAMREKNHLFGFCIMKFLSPIRVFNPNQSNRNIFRFPQFHQLPLITYSSL